MSDAFEAKPKKLTLTTDGTCKGAVFRGGDSIREKMYYVFERPPFFFVEGRHERALPHPAVIPRAQPERIPLYEVRLGQGDSLGHCVPSE